MKEKHPIFVQTKMALELIEKGNITGKVELSFDVDADTIRDVCIESKAALLFDPNGTPRYTVMWSPHELLTINVYSV